MIGNLLGNRYEIMEQLGGGGMAVVYKGRDTILNRLVTIKVLRSEYTSDEEFVKRFRSEAQAVASLSHPNIVSIYDVGRAENVDYLVMEYIEGDNLKNVIRQHGPLLPVKAAQIARQISHALEHAHENNIVHRDVKPQNVLITRDGRAKLTDFGIAMGATAATIAKAEGVMGSVHYVSPEQAKGEKTGPRSDIYSLGVVLYEMSTGALPFQGETPVGVAVKHIQEEPPLPSLVNPAIPLNLEKIITRAMAKSPADRFETARQFSQELAVISGTGPDPFHSSADDEFATQVIPTFGSGQLEPDIRPTGRQASGKKKSYAWLWALFIVAGLFIAGAMAYQYLFNVKEVVMPKVTGQTAEDAKKQLNEIGISNIRVENTHTDASINIVVNQDPSDGTKIKVTRQVVLSVSVGPERVTVSKVVGLKLDEARNELVRVGLKVTEPVGSEYSEEYEEGKVMDQNPKGNESVNKGTLVVLTVSKGKEPVIVLMPDLSGMALDDARAELAKIKLTVADANITRTPSLLYDSGEVINQSPVGGTEVREGDTVRLTVSNGPGLTSYTQKIGVTVNDNLEHRLRIEVTDEKGTRDAVDEPINKQGLVENAVTYYGRATIKVYLDGRLVEQSMFEGGRRIG